MSSKLQALMADVSGASFISIDTVTVPKLKGGKSNPMQGQVRKVMVGANVMVFSMKNGGSAYENMVMRRLAQEGKDPKSFELGARAWGERIEGTPFIEHNGALYLEVIFLKPGKTHFTHGVRPIDRSEVIGLEEAGDGGEQGGLDNKVIIRTFKADSISSITINGQRHVLN